MRLLFTKGGRSGASNIDAFYVALMQNFNGYMNEGDLFVDYGDGSGKRLFRTHDQLEVIFEKMRWQHERELAVRKDGDVLYLKLAKELWAQAEKQELERLMGKAEKAETKTKRL